MLAGQPQAVGGFQTFCMKQVQVTTRSQWRRWLAGLGVKAAFLEDLPQKLSGWGLSLCNGKFWGEGMGLEAHRRGLRIVWSRHP